MIAWLLGTVVASSIAMLFVLTVRAPIRTHFGSRVAYILWAIPLLRLFIPSIPSSWGFGWSVPIVGGASKHDSNLPLLMQAEGSGLTPLPPLRSSWVSVHDYESLVSSLTIIWALGAVVFSAYHILRYHNLYRTVLRNSLSSSVRLIERVHVVHSAAVSSPVAFGIRRKYIALPDDFAERFVRVERDLALMHELCHHRRGDIQANWVAFSVLCINWWNPIAWWSYRAFRVDQEMACDATVLSGREADAKYAYGCAIAKSAGISIISLACGLRSIGELQRRLETLAHEVGGSSGRTTAGLVAVGALTLVVIAATASATPISRPKWQTTTSPIGQPSATRGGETSLPHVAHPTTDRAAFAQIGQSPHLSSATTRRASVSGRSAEALPQSNTEVEDEPATKAAKPSSANVLAARFEYESLSSTLPGLYAQRASLIAQPDVPSEKRDEAAAVIDRTIRHVRERVISLGGAASTRT